MNNPEGVTYDSPAVDCWVTVDNSEVLTKLFSPENSNSSLKGIFPLFRNTRVVLSKEKANYLLQRELEIQSTIAPHETAMETKRTTTRFSYRIEEKPGGGFIARSTDPGVEPLEGETREEVLRNVEAKISAIIGEQLPSFKFGGLNLTAKTRVNVTHQTRFGDSSNLSSSPDFSQRGLPQSSDSMGPIMRGDQSNPIGVVLRILAALIGAGALVYFFLHR